MKRITLTGIVLMFATISQAALINWGNAAASSIYGLDGITPLTQAAGNTANLTVTLIDVTDANTVEQTLGPSGAISSMTAGALLNANLTYTYGTGGSAIGNGDNFYINLTATFGTQQYEMKVYENNTKDDYFTITATGNTGTDNFNWTAGTYGGVGVAGDVGKWVPVPEPTSMALFGLGAAVLGLRRRFKKKA